VSGITRSFLASLSLIYSLQPILVVARYKDWVYGRSLPQFVGSNPGELLEVSVANNVCCQVKLSAMGRSFVQRSPTQCRVPEYDRETLTMRSPWPTGGFRIVNKTFIALLELTIIEYRRWRS
jgi:hypothetical protein